MGNDTDIPEMEGYELWAASLVAKRHPGLQHNLEPEEAEKDNLALGKEYAFADSDHLHELIERSESGEIQKSSLAQLYENRQAHAVSLLNEQLQTLNMQRLEAQRLQVQILDDQLYESSYNLEDGWNVSEESLPRSDLFIGDDGPGSWSSLPTSECSTSELEGDHSVEYWRDRARGFSKLLAESIRREEILEKRLQEFTSAASPMQHLEELGLQPNRFDDFLRFCLKKAPIIIAHQDAELRYRFIYNAFPTLTEEEVIGKTDMEILSGVGIMEVVEFKKEVMRKGWPEKREFTFNTDLFGEKTFLIALEPVMNKSGESIGLNYISVDISDQVDKREQLMCLREEGAVQKAMETELNRTIHITEETMRAKQMLATMSHEIRSPLSGVVSVAEVLATTCLDAEQRQLVDVMLSSGDLVLQLINDILDLSKVESGAMKFEAKKFRFREVVKHVLQTAAASVQNKRLDLQESVNDDVPPEVIGDVLRIRQVFTNLVSNAIKFTNKGSVKIIVRVVPPPSNLVKAKCNEQDRGDIWVSLENLSLQESSHLKKPLSCNPPAYDRREPDPQQTAMSVETSKEDRHEESSSASTSLETVESTRETIWLQCEVCDTGIGIPEAALPKLFEKYTQASTTHARQYGGTGLGLAICKNLVELMGGSITVRSKVNEGSTFSFTLPLQVAEQKPSSSSGKANDNVYGMMSNEQERSSGRKTQDYSSYRKTSGYPDFSASGYPTSIRPRSSRSESKRPTSTVVSPATDGRYVPSSNAPRTIRSDTERVVTVGKPSLGPFTRARMDGRRAGAFKSDRSSLTKPQLFVNRPEEEPESRTSSTSTGDNVCSQSSDPVGTRSSENQRPIGQTSLAKSPSQTGPVRGLKKNMTKGSEGEREGVFSRGSGSQPKPSRILLAEDNKVNVMVAQSMLTKLGHVLEVANNGADAIQALQRNSYDLILMDVCMPVMDGLEATRRIRRYEETGSWLDADEEIKRMVVGDSGGFLPDARFADAAPPQNVPRRRTPIIAMTANALADNVSDCYSHGMDSFIAKPVTFTKLQQVLEQFIPSVDAAGSATAKSKPTSEVQISTRHQDGKDDKG